MVLFYSFFIQRVLLVFMCLVPPYVYRREFIGCVVCVVDSNHSAAERARQRDRDRLREVIHNTSSLLPENETFYLAGRDKKYIYIYTHIYLEEQTCVTTKLPSFTLFPRSHFLPLLPWP